MIGGENGETYQVHVYFLPFQDSALFSISSVLTSFFFFLLTFLTTFFPSLKYSAAVRKMSGYSWCTFCFREPPYFFLAPNWDLPTLALYTLGVTSRYWDCTGTSYRFQCGDSGKSGTWALAHSYCDQRSDLTTLPLPCFLADCCAEIWFRTRN